MLDIEQMKKRARRTTCLQRSDRESGAYLPKRYLDERQWEDTDKNNFDVCSSLQHVETRKVFLCPVLPHSQRPIYAFRRRGLEPFLTCSFERYTELTQNDQFETKVLFEAPGIEL